MINKEQSLFEIIKNFPETLEVFELFWFKQIVDEKKLNTIWKNITLEQATAMKSINLVDFIDRLEEKIEELRIEKEEKNKLTLVWLLPCPVKHPLLDALNTFMIDYKKKTGLDIVYDLKPATEWAAWIEKNIKSSKCLDDIPDIFISAWFETFFDKNTIGQFRKQWDLMKIEKYKTINSSFNWIKISDPKSNYQLLWVVPAIFMIDKNVIWDIEPPKTREDLLDKRFENKISIPVWDFEIFNVLLLNIFKLFWNDWIKKLSRNVVIALHPVEWVKQKSKIKPAVTIMPYFFTKMVWPNSSMQPYWPDDGAIISPIYLLWKQSKKDIIKPVTDFFMQDSTSEIMMQKGAFPTLNPKLDNKLEKWRKFLWLWWDYIEENNLTILINKCVKIYEIYQIKKSINK